MHDSGERDSPKIYIPKLLAITLAKGKRFLAYVKINSAHCSLSYNSGEL